jgi:oxygen-dependent protoporphyrinogen oxidase
MVVEEAGRVGGVIRSAEVEGRVLDWGPQRTRLTPQIRSLVRELGIEDEVLTAPADLDLFVFRDGKLREVPFSPQAFVRSDLVSTGGKLRMLLEPFTGGPRPEERVSKYFRRKLGNEIYETIVAPLYGGLYASDPADMEVGLSLIHVLRNFGIGRSLLVALLRKGGRITPPPACSFKAGMQTLPDALAASLGDRVSTDTAVTSLRRHGGGWVVSIQASEGRREISAEHVVLSVPAPVAARLLEPVAPEVAETVGRLRYNPLGVVHLDADTPLHGLGFQVAFTERNRALRGVTFNHSLFGRNRLYTAYLGGALRPDVTHLSAERLGEIAAREFRDTTGYEARPIHADHEWVPAWDVSWRGLWSMPLPQGITLTGNWWSRPGLPGRLTEAEGVARVLTEGVEA